MAKKNDDVEGCLGCLALIVLAGIGYGIYYVFQNPWLLIPIAATVGIVIFLYQGYATQSAEKEASKQRLAEYQAKQREKLKQQQAEEQASRERAAARRKQEETERLEQAERDWFEDEVAKIAEADESIAKLRFMSGAEFEDFMADFLAFQGYEVEHLAGAGDQGVDLILTQTGKRIAVQLKQYSRPLGNKPIQEVHTGRFIHKADEAWVITTSSFTRGGIEAAQKTYVRLIDGDELFEWIKDANEELDN